MDRGEDEATAVVEDVDALPDFPVDLVGSSEREGRLRLDPAAPEDEVGSELLLEGERIHVRCGRLDGVEDVEAVRDELGDQLVDAAVAMLERLPGGAGMDRGIDRPVVGSRTGYQETPMRFIG